MADLSPAPDKPIKALPRIPKDVSTFDLSEIETADQVAVTFAYAIELTETGSGMGVDYVRMYKSSLADGFPSNDDPLLHIRLVLSRLSRFLERVANVRSRSFVEQWARYTVEDLTLAEIGEQYDRDASSVWRSNRLTRELIEDWLEKGKL